MKEEKKVMIKQEERAKNVEVYKERSSTCECKEVTERSRVKFPVIPNLSTIWSHLGLLTTGKRGPSRL
jgi:hypothetical protein